MIQLDFTVEEEQTLKEELRRRLLEIEHEIHHTSTADFKKLLNHQRDVLQKLYDRLP